MILDLIKEYELKSFKEYILCSADEGGPKEVNFVF